MLYKLMWVLIFIACLGWFFKENIKEFGRSWYLGVPLPVYTVTIDHGIPITMSDGVDLIADVYRPEEKGKYPTILTRTPYDRQNADNYYEEIAKLFVGQGFIFIVQDVRGKRPSQGEFYPHLNDVKDGSETISWIVKQPWSDGQISLFGFSYLGATAWQALSQSESKIATSICWSASSNPYRLWYDKGVAYLKPFIFWMSKYSGTGSKDILPSDVDLALSKTTDWQELDIALTGQKIPAYRDFLTHPIDDDFWNQFSVPLSHLNQDVPVLLGSGWYDQFLTTTIDDFKVLRQAPEGSRRRESRLILGPWAHNPTQKIKGIAFSSESNFLKQFMTMLQWYQKWMGKDSSFQLAPVSYYLVGENQWRTAIDWPPPEAQSLKYYLDASGEQSLSPHVPQAGKSSLVFDPHQFVPTIGGRMLYNNGNEGPQDQSSLASRSDVLFWSSSLLQQPLSIVGAAKLHVYLSETPLNFDLSIKLIDLFPDGKMQLITDGYLRIKREEGESPFTVDISLADTAYVVPSNHRVQIAITHSDFPNHEPNKYPSSTTKALINILTGSESPSSIEIFWLP